MRGHWTCCAAPAVKKFWVLLSGVEARGAVLVAKRLRKAIEEHALPAVARSRFPSVSAGSRIPRATRIWPSGRQKEPSTVLRMPDETK